MSFGPSLPDLTEPGTLHNLLRVVIIIAAYLLLRPHLDRLFRHISGAPDTRTEQLKARLSVMHEEQERKKMR